MTMVLFNETHQQLFGQLAHIFYSIVFPILLIAAIGWVLQRRFGLEMGTLRRLNFYFVIPCLMYHAIVTSTLSAENVGKVFAFAGLMLLGNGVFAFVVARLRGVHPGHRNTLLMRAMLHNSGNYGLPLQESAFGPAGMALQIFYTLARNLAHFTIGVVLAAGGRTSHWKENLVHIAKFPPLYALAAGAVTVLLRNALGPQVKPIAKALAPFWQVINYLRDAFIAVALGTLRAQPALVRRGARHYPVPTSVILRLLAGPAIGLGMVYLLGLRGFLAQVMFVAAATPTSVNTMLLCLEFDNNPQYASKAVFYSTLLSPVTVTGVIFPARSGYLPGIGP